MSNKRILMELYNLGYTIAVKTTNDSKVVTLKSQTSYSYTLPRSYSLEYTDDEVRLDCVPDILNWSGLKVQEILTH